MKKYLRNDQIVSILREFHKVLTGRQDASALDDKVIKIIRRKAYEG